MNRGCRVCGLAAALAVVIAACVGKQPVPPEPTESIGAVTRSVIRVPGDAATIQVALDLARSGDTVLVSAGICEGEGNRDLRFSGASLRMGAVAAVSCAVASDICRRSGVLISSYNAGGDWHDQIGSDRWRALPVGCDGQGGAGGGVNRRKWPSRASLGRRGCEKTQCG